MEHEFLRREVLNNLIRFKDSLLEKKRKISSDQERIYKVLINCKTGEMRFPEKIKSLESRFYKQSGHERANDWKEAHIVANSQFAVEYVDPIDIEPFAWGVISETIDVLNAIAQKHLSRELTIEEIILSELSSLQTSRDSHRIEELPAWAGKIGREEAEKKLEGTIEGTYLLRGADPLTQAMGFHFTESNQMLVEPFLLTVVEGDEKISDILLIQTPKGWTLYHDDPNLNDIILYKYEPSPEAVIRELTEVVKQPFRHKK